ncbi:MAG TPA: cyclic pyranopterin monophosphate synthase MoaC [Myxococcales bacterium]|nr:cyclic pyranopterin monophosphate synthase MoaC [Myxococcales bacterium]
MSNDSTRELSHARADGSVHMVEVGDKAVTHREAVAEATVTMASTTLRLIRENNLKKGDLLATARLAGIMAAKQTPQLIPLCHPLQLTGIDVELKLQDSPPAVVITTSVRCTGQTGVEMEALTAASVAALTVIDMAKAVDKNMVIGPIQLLEKSGGRSGHWQRAK